MTRTILIRIASLIPLVILASFVTFWLLQLTETDPAVVRLGDDATEEQTHKNIRRSTRNTWC